MNKALRTDATADVVHKFNPYVHGARGLFAFMIVVFHVVNSGLPTLPVLASGLPLFLLRSTEHGVELFFGISGIVIVGALARAKGPLVFALERGTRIYPVLWASIACIVVLSALTGYEGRMVPSLLILVANLLALPPLVPGPLIHPAAWSLSYELAFYGFCALAWALRRRLGAWAFLLVAPAAVIAVGWHVRTFLMPVGMGVAALLAAYPALGRLSKVPGVSLLAFLVIWEVVCEGSGGDLTPLSILQLRPILAGFSIMAALVAALAFAGILAGQGLFSRVLVLPPLQALGTMSYSLYLWHPIIMSVVKGGMHAANLPARIGGASQILFFLLVLPPSLLIAWISQRLLETRVTKWLRRALEGSWVSRSQERAPATVSHPPLELERRPEATGS